MEPIRHCDDLWIDGDGVRWFQSCPWFPPKDAKYFSNLATSRDNFLSSICFVSHDTISIGDTRKKARSMSGMRARGHIIKDGGPRVRERRYDIARSGRYTPNEVLQCR